MNHLKILDVCLDFFLQFNAEPDTWGFYMENDLFRDDFYN